MQISTVKQFTQSVLVLLISILLIGCTTTDRALNSDSSSPDQILYNGKVLTVDEGFTIAEAIAIRDGKILAVGESENIVAMAGESTDQTDLQGRTVIPGLIDNHFHYLRGTNSAAYEMRIQGITSRQQVLDDISARAEELGPGKWIFIIGAWHEQQFEDRPGKFTREELDAAAPNNPVFIQRTYSAFYLNQLAADVLREVNPEWMADDDMIYVDNREGRFVMYAALEYFPFAQDLEGRKGQVTAFNNYLTSLGITTTYDAGYLDGSYDAVEALHEENALPLRIFYAARYWAETARTSIAAAEMLDREEPFQRDDRFGMFGIGEHVHGLLHDSSSTVIDISDATYDEWAMIVRSAAKNGWYVNEHAMRDDTANRMMDIVEEISEDYATKDLRWTLGHVDLVQPETIQRAKELGWNITLANHTVKVKFDGIASPNVRAIQDSGILWGLGSDGTIVATYNPFHTIWEYTAGKIFPNIVKYQPDEVITREEALIAHTRSNSYIMFMEDKIGTLEAGKFADLVVLDRDYMTVPIDEIKDLKPVITMVEGEVVYQAE